ncbi:MAG TPA: hypothetical protein VEX63_06995, partial [Flavisolibacter sp.]|nr:hypothetical protein [Flavisolibacter sp.]
MIVKSVRLFFIFMLSIAGNLFAQHAYKLPKGQYERSKVVVKLKKQPATQKATRVASLKKSFSH